MKKFTPEQKDALWRAGEMIAKQWCRICCGTALPDLEYTMVEEDDDDLIRRTASSVGLDYYTDDAEEFNAIYSIVTAGYKAWIRSKSMHEEENAEELE
jgi:hypothetical protein